MDNILNEEKDDVMLVTNVLDNIKSYLDPERFKKEHDARKQEQSKRPAPGDPYVQKLMEKGASLESALGEKS